MIDISHRTSVRIHLTNVAGAGASQLVESLLPALESAPNVLVERIMLPDRGRLASYRSSNPATVVEVYTRHLPNALSRILECTLLAKHFDGDSPLLVLGDMPLRCQGKQIVFLQQAILLKSCIFSWRLSYIKVLIGRFIFKWNLDRVSAFIVQTEVMRNTLEHKHPSVVGRVHVISQPVPSWLMYSGLRRLGRIGGGNRPLDLIYPSASYFHKNHLLLSRLNPQAGWPVRRLALTIDSIENPAPKLSWIECCGFLSPAEMIKAYSQVDALLFLSKNESYGFPLVEAMFVGLPIVCPDLPYAHTLCGDQGIYFDPDNPDSLLQALIILNSRLESGWWPDYTNRLRNIPKDWDSVARQMLAVVFSPTYKVIDQMSSD